MTKSRKSRRNTGLVLSPRPFRPAVRVTVGNNLQSRPMMSRSVVFRVKRIVYVKIVIIGGTVLNKRRTSWKKGMVMTGMTRDRDDDNGGGKGPKKGPPDSSPKDGNGSDDEDVPPTRISRKEADKITVPSFPKILHVDNWKAQVTAAVLGACGDTNQEPWIKWLYERYKPRPDIEGLNDSGGLKYSSIDLKLANAVMSMLKAGGDECYDLCTEVITKSNRCMRGNAEGRYTVIKGRQIIAMMMESFRARDRLDLVYTIEQLGQLQYPGDAKLAHSRTVWMEIIHNMRPEDVPSSRALRDTLYSKIKGSNLMQLELKFYDMMHVDDPNRTESSLGHNAGAPARAGSRT